MIISFYAAKVNIELQGEFPRILCVVTIVLTGGGTAGHVLPHFAVLPHLRGKFDRVVYIGGHDGIEREIIGRENARNGQKIEYRPVTCVKLRRSLTPRNLAIPYKLIKGISEAKRVLRDVKPAAVFSKGGFVAYPVVRAAAKLGIPVVAHESDLTMGLANRMSAKFAAHVCTTFKQTKQTDNTVWTGAPVRQQIFKGVADIVSKRHGFGAGRRLLVMGGSLGAEAINRLLRDAVGDLAEYNIVHICGKGKLVVWHENGRYVQLEYADDIENYLAWADVVVSRAGSNALCELILLKKPTVFIPLQSGRGDQVENAGLITDARAGVVLNEADLDARGLVSAIREVWKHRELYAANCGKVGVADGSKVIANTIYGVV